MQWRSVTQEKSGDLHGQPGARAAVSPCWFCDWSCSVSVCAYWRLSLELVLSLLSWRGGRRRLENGSNVGAALGCCLASAVRSEGFTALPPLCCSKETVFLPVHWSLPQGKTCSALLYNNSVLPSVKMRLLFHYPDLGSSVNDNLTVTMPRHALTANSIWTKVLGQLLIIEFR